MVLRVDQGAACLELRGRAGLAGLLARDAELVQDGGLPLLRLLLHVDVAVQRDEGAVLELAEGVDLGEGEAVLGEGAGQPAHDVGEPHQLAAGDAQGGDHLLRLEVGEGEEGGEVGLGDVVRVLFRHLLDVDAAHVAEDHDGELGQGVVGDAGVVLLLDGGLRLDEDGARLLAVDLEVEDGGGLAPGLLRRVGEPDAAGLHAAAGEHLRLEHDRPADVLRQLRGLLRRLGGAALGEADAALGEEALGFVFVEPHPPVQSLPCFQSK